MGTDRPSPESPPRPTGIRYTYHLGSLMLIIAAIALWLALLRQSAMAAIWSGFLVLALAMVVAWKRVRRGRITGLERLVLFGIGFLFMILWMSIWLAVARTFAP